MNKNTLKCVIVTSVISFSTVSIAVECKMNETYVHNGKNKNTKIYTSESGLPSIFYSSNMDVNTDGAARSYHPDDPNGKTIAYNNIANAITKAWHADGTLITCDGGDAAKRRGACYSEYINAFIGAKNVNFSDTKFPRIETTYIIPWKKDAALGWDVPCTIKSGKNEGFFISQTSARVNPSGDKCDQTTYLDSLTVNAVVRSGGARWKSQGIITDDGDLVIVRNNDTGKISYAIQGDVGPSKNIGEGTIALTSDLSGISISSNATYSEIRKLVVKNADYLIFPSHDAIKQYSNQKELTQDLINDYGKEIFDKWGGVERLNSCSG